MASVLWPGEILLPDISSHDLPYCSHVHKALSHVRVGMQLEVVNQVLLIYQDRGFSRLSVSFYVGDSSPIILRKRLFHDKAVLVIFFIPNTK